MSILIEEDLFKYCKKLYLLFGTGKFNRDYFMAAPTYNPFYDEYYGKYNYTSAHAENLFLDGYISNNVFGEVFFTKKFVDYLEKTCD